MQYRFSDRMGHVPESFLGRLFAVSKDPKVISFAGGLPSSAAIDRAGLARAAAEVLEEDGCAALQYSTTDGYLPLRTCIADRYRARMGLLVDPSEIQIVNGSQQCLDLVAKILLNPGDRVGIESPGYLGAIEAFSLYQPRFCPVPLEDPGPDPALFEEMVRKEQPAFFYGVPNSQNPSGRTYAQKTRQELAAICREYQLPFYEDDAFGELFFDGRSRIPVKCHLPELGILSGSFSKTVAPGMRIGWICAPPRVLEKFNIAKQAADLHSNHLCQMILHRYLARSDLDAHLERVVRMYGEHCRCMCDCLDEIPGLTHTTPEGGIFMMATLPAGISSMDVFTRGVSCGVAVLPLVPFHVDGGGYGSIRLNFSSSGVEEIKEGASRLAAVLRDLS
ncbi:MAG: PLP-dependent aminotransferase family protein [Methanomicrobiaceae archaeon]|nr:PLP-dependent aminotransferase family protein [Methanomicrobiaceae archaeon]